MTITSRIDAAIRLASHLHRNQTRKDKYKTPYVSHLYTVASLLSEVTNDEDIIIAGLMHDSLEDVPGYTFDQLVEDCGLEVATIVKHVTEPMNANALQQLPWLTRKEEYLRVLQEGDYRSALVSAADKIHNTESFIRDVEEEGESFLMRFDSSLHNKLAFHEKVLAVIENKITEDNALVTRLRACTEEFRNCIASVNNPHTVNV